MQNKLLILVRNFIEDRGVLKSVFKMESTYLYPVCAAEFAMKGCRAQEAKLRSCKKLLKSRVGAFSNLRGNLTLPMTCRLAVSDDADKLLTRTLEIYTSLKKQGKFFASSYLPLAAMVIAELVPEGQEGEIILHTRRFYDTMKEAHFFLTSSEDSVFAALLAIPGRDPEDASRECEACYQELRLLFPHAGRNMVQSLCHVLALSEGEALEKCRRTRVLYDALKGRGAKYSTGYELPTLGVLAMLSENVDAIAEELLTADELLSQEKGYGVFGLGKKQRLMHAGMLVCAAHEGTDAMGSAALSSAVSLVIAQEAALCAVIAASAANSAT